MGLKADIKLFFKRGLKPLQSQYYAWMDAIYFKDESIPVGQITIGEQVLVCDATTVFDYSVHSNAAVTLTENTTLDIQNMEVGNFAGLVIQQDGTGGRTFAFPTGSQVAYDEVIDDAADAFSFISIYRSSLGYFITVNPSWTEQ